MMSFLTRLPNILLRDRLLTFSVTFHKSILGFRYYSKEEPLNPDNLGVDEEWEEEDAGLENIADIESKRNKSRLSVAHRNIMHNCVPYSEPKSSYHEALNYKRRMFGTYGEFSGPSLSMLWPSRQELADTREYEAVAYPLPLLEAMEHLSKSKKEREAQVRKREEDISKKLAKLEQWKHDLNERIKKKEAEAYAVKAKRERLVEEVRRHFGFKVDPRDDRFKEMLEKKEKEEKKMVKEARRSEREAKNLAKLAELSKQYEQNSPPSSK